MLGWLLLSLLSDIYHLMLILIILAIVVIFVAIVIHDWYRFLPCVCLYLQGHLLFTRITLGIHCFHAPLQELQISLLPRNGNTSTAHQPGKESHDVINKHVKNRRVSQCYKAKRLCFEMPRACQLRCRRTAGRPCRLLLRSKHVVQSLFIVFLRYPGSAFNLHSTLSAFFNDLVQRKLQAKMAENKSLSW